MTPADAVLGDALREAGYEWAKVGWLCLWHRARLTLLPPESASGASAPRPSGETP